MFSEHMMTLPAGQFLPASRESTPLSLAPSIDEIMLPEQLFTYARNAAATWTGEQRLLLAVLEDALANFFRYRGARTTRGKRLFREECEWFWSKEKNCLYAFETVC